MWEDDINTYIPIYGVIVMYIMYTYDAIPEK